jgi:hypothetical protein
MQTPLIEPEIPNPGLLFTEQICERKFRRLAGLCVECGKNPAKKGRLLCDLHCQEREISQMEIKWKRWGIAA